MHFAAWTTSVQTRVSTVYCTQTIDWNTGRNDHWPRADNLLQSVHWHLKYMYRVSHNSQPFLSRIWVAGLHTMTVLQHYQDVFTGVWIPLQLLVIILWTCTVNFLQAMLNDLQTPCYHHDNFTACNKNNWISQSQVTKHCTITTQSS